MASKPLLFNLSTFTETVGLIDLTAMVTGLLPATNINVDGTSLNGSGTSLSINNLGVTAAKLSTGTGSDWQQLIYDSNAGALAWRTNNAIVQPCRVVATSNITISAPGTTIDGVSLNINDRVLLTGQSTASQNGCYVFNGSSAAMTRTYDTNAGTRLASGTIIQVWAGTLNANTLWMLSTDNAITIGTTNLAFTELNSSSSGTVTSVSIVPANGISGTVATATTTPAITLSLGNIIPSSITIGSNSSFAFGNTASTPLFQTVHNASTGQAVISLTEWATSSSVAGEITFLKSKSGTIGTIGSGLTNLSTLGTISWYGVNTSGAIALAASIAGGVTINGSTYIGSDILFKVGTNSAAPATALTVTASGITTNSVTALVTASSLYQLNLTGQTLLDSSSSGASLATVNGVNASAQIIGATQSSSSFLLAQYNNTSGTVPPLIQFAKSAGSSVNVLAAVSNNDLVSQLDYNAVNANGTPAMVNIGFYRTAIDGTPGTTYVPMRHEWWTGSATAAPILGMKLDSGQNLTVTNWITSAGMASPVNALGTVGSTATANFLTSSTNTATLTSATSCTFSFTAPLANSYIELIITQPASGTATTITLPSTSGPAIIQPTATLGAKTTYSFFYDGSTYTLVSQTNSPSGTVTSTALALPSSVFSISGSPITGSGTLTGTFINQAINTVFAGPSSGGSNVPTFRSLVAADIPSLPASQITTGTIATSLLGSGTANSTSVLLGNQTWGTVPNAGLTNSSVTIGTTAIALGATATTLAGLTSVAATTFIGSGFANTTNALGTVGATATANFTTSATVTATLTSATACTFSFTAPANANTTVKLIITQPASGTVTTITLPGTVVGNFVQPTATLGAKTTYYLFYDGSTYTIVGASNSPNGTVTSVGLTLPSAVFTVGSSITTSGNVSATFANQNANIIFAGPSTGSPATPTFRSLASGDFGATIIPNTALVNSSLTIGSTNIALGATATTLAGLTSVTATTFTGSGASLTSLNASNLSTGTVGTGLLGSGTANNAAFLRGDQTWSSTLTGPLTATSHVDSTAGALGTVTTTATANFTTSNTVTATLTSADICTLTFTAPASSNCFVKLALTQPASGSVTTVVFPTTVTFNNGVIVQPVPILNATTEYIFWWNGTSYYLVGEASSVGVPLACYPLTATSTGPSSATYVGNKFSIPANALQVGTAFRITMYFTNSATASSTTIQAKFGTAGTTSDATINGTFTTVGTAVIGAARVEIFAVCRATGSSGTLVVTTTCTNNGAAGFDDVATRIVQNTATINTTVANFLGLAWLQSTSGIATIQNINYELLIS